MDEPTAASALAPDADSVEALGKVAGAWRHGGRDYLPYRLMLLAKLLDRWSTRVLLDISGLSVAEWRVLALLAAGSPLSVRTLAEQNHVDRAEVSRAAASLEAAGHIERRDNPKDRRSPYLYCTARGLELAGRVSPQRRAFHKSLTDLLRPEEVEALDIAMLTLAKRCIEALDAEGAKPRRAARGKAGGLPQMEAP